MDFDYEGAEDFGGNILWGRIAVFGFALVLALLLGRCTSGGGGVDQSVYDTLVTEKASVDTALQAKDQTIAQLQQQLSEARASQQAGTVTPGTTDGTTGTTGTTPPADTTTGQTDASGNRIYEVQPGDTLSTIAASVYGDPTAFAIIASANNISGANQLQIGQQLIIPPNPDAGQ